MNLHLVDPNPELVAQWRKYFAVLPNVTITQGKFQEIDNYECLINAGNSFGIMDGGVDGYIDHEYPTVAKRVQSQIVYRYAGEQPIGTSFITFIGGNQPTGPIYLAHTPTMRVPENIADTDNVYYAMRAALLAIREHNADHKNRYKRGESVPRDGSGWQIEAAVVMGLGTATGKVPFDKAAHQMALAYSSVLMPITNISWEEALRRHDAVRALDIGHQPVVR